MEHRNIGPMTARTTGRRGRAHLRPAVEHGALLPSRRGVLGAAGLVAISLSGVPAAASSPPVEATRYLVMTNPGPGLDRSIVGLDVFLEETARVTLGHTVEWALRADGEVLALASMSEDGSSLALADASTLAPLSQTVGVSAFARGTLRPRGALAFEAGSGDELALECVRFETQSSGPGTQIVSWVQRFDASGPLGPTYRLLPIGSDSVAEVPRGHIRVLGHDDGVVYLLTPGFRLQRVHASEGLLGSHELFDDVAKTERVAGHAWLDAHVVAVASTAGRLARFDTSNSTVTVSSFDLGLDEGERTGSVEFRRYGEDWRLFAGVKTGSIRVTDRVVALDCTSFQQVASYATPGAADFAPGPGGEVAYIDPHAGSVTLVGPGGATRTSAFDDGWAILALP